MKSTTIKNLKKKNNAKTDMTTVLPSGMITNCFDKKKADNNITNMTSKTGAMTNNIQKKIDNIQKLSQGRGSL